VLHTHDSEESKDSGGEREEGGEERREAEQLQMSGEDD